MDKALFYLSLARKAGLAELGEEPVGAAARAGSAKLVLVATDASEHTWRRAKSYVAGTNQQCIRIPYTKDEMGFAIGRTALAIAALTDAGIAVSLVEALEQPEQYDQVLLVLKDMAERSRRRAKEAKPHTRKQKPGKGKPAKQK